MLKRKSRRNCVKLILIGKKKFRRSDEVLGQTAQEMVQSLSLEVLEKGVDVALRDMVQWAWWGWADGWTR